MRSRRQPLSWMLTLISPFALLSQPVSPPDAVVMLTDPKGWNLSNWLEVREGTKHPHECWDEKGLPRKKGCSSILTFKPSGHFEWTFRGDQVQYRLEGKRLTLIDDNGRQDVYEIDQAQGEVHVVD